MSSTAGRKSVEVNLDDRVWMSEQRNAGLNLPLAVDRRIDHLLAIAVDAGERTSRKELVAAIVCSVDLDEEHLVEMLRTYRRLTNRDVLPGTSAPDAAVVSLTANRPGPRPVAGGSAG